MLAHQVLGASDHRVRADLERHGQCLNGAEGWRLEPAFELADVRRVTVAREPEFFLRHPNADAVLAKRPPERLLDRFRLPRHGEALRTQPLPP